jgi:hypothetical protein
MFTIPVPGPIVSPVGSERGLFLAADRRDAMQSMFGLEVLFASVVCMTTALTFVEVRRLRKKLK